MQTVYKNKVGEILNVNLIKEQYFSYMLRNEIAKYHGCSWQQIDKIIRDFKWYRKFKPKYLTNEKYFKKINTESKAYFFGLMLADGSISKDEKTLKISLQEKDLHILEKFKTELESNSPIIFTKVKNPNHSNYYTLSIYSKKLCADLVKLGCINNKSKYLEWNINVIPKKLINHFIRGYFDGDGCFSYRLYKQKHLKSVINFTSTENFCIGLKNLIKDYFSYNMYMSCRNKKTKSNNRTVEINGNKQVTSLLNWLYKDASIFLNRKKEKVDSFLVSYKNFKYKTV
jgi:intein/homing endonuclease